MQTVITFNVERIDRVNKLFYTLHTFFANSIKCFGYNPYGISFPKITNEQLGSFLSVHCPEKYDELLSYFPLQKLITSSQAKMSSVYTIDYNDKAEFIAFIRDRRLERGAPPKAMRDLQKSSNGDELKNQRKMRFRMERYFSHSLPSITMQSISSARQFTINIATQKSAFPSTQKMYFNSYGLSSYINPIFLPIRDEK